MSWNNAHTPQIWPPVFKDLVLIALAVYRFRRRSLPSVLPFANPLQSGSIWIVGSGLELAIVDAATKISWVKQQAAWLLPGLTAIKHSLKIYGPGAG